jgi:hypothetical protein
MMAAMVTRSRRRKSQAREPLVVGPSRATVRAAVESLSDDLRWEELCDGLRPVFVRRRPLPPGVEPPVTFKVRLGLTVALGVDIGPAFLYVGPNMLDSWPVTASEAWDRAMGNLRSSVEAERFLEMEYGTVADVPIWWYQSHGGLASGLLLLEEELARRYGPEPRLLAAPMRNLLLAAPFDADRDLVQWLSNEISHEDPNGLELPLFTLVDGKLAVDGQPPSGHLVH